ncbi:hypothetical protein Glove_139g25 [Diversispora epigaea]|uniref:Uncharacterized protein n=1 Tax=Diversispora epigaea TaxID=1348612 RepID=A0A397IVY7_9GLOM|nr:hypothetical protein Glove_139g25 [Diversispora epigaea]
MLNRRVSEVALPLGIKYLGIESTSWPRFNCERSSLFSGPRHGNPRPGGFYAELPYDMDEINHKAGVNLPVSISLSYMLNRRVSEVALPLGIKYLGIESTSWPRFNCERSSLFSGPRHGNPRPGGFYVIPVTMQEQNSLMTWTK